MSKSKLVFVVLSVIFIIILIIVAIDISSRTTFPGKKKQGTEQFDSDSVRVEQE